MIDLKAIKGKAEAANQPPIHQTAWLPDEETVSADYVRYMFSLTPEIVLKLLRIIEVQGDALDKIKSPHMLRITSSYIAKTALEQVSKILTEQNEGGGK